MEVIENKSKYLRRESRKQKALRILRKFFWVLPLLFIAIGLLIAWQLIRSIQKESARLPGVNYEEFLEPSRKAKKEVKKLELYRQKMKKEKEQKITSRYERIISGSQIVGKLDYGKEIPPGDSAAADTGQAPAFSSAPEQETGRQEEEKLPVQVTTVRQIQRSSSPTRGKEKEPSFPDTLEQADSLPSLLEAPDPFYTLKAVDTGMVRYTRAHFFGDQDILNGTYIRLRLGEDMRVNGKVIPRNTVFRGMASLSQNKIEIKVDRIGSQAIAGRICDQDYNHGIVIPASKRESMEDAVKRSLYQTGTGTAMDLPFEILQDVSQNIIRNKRRKQSIIRINDGYLVYITQTNQ